MAKQKINVKLLRKITKKILAEPLSYEQNVWIERVTDGSSSNIIDLNGAIPPCGTMACIGGWATILGESLNASHNLGLDEWQARRLFAPIYKGGEFCWPEKYRTAYRAAKTPRGRARVAARRISHFIKTNGAE